MGRARERHFVEREKWMYQSVKKAVDGPPHHRGGMLAWPSRVQAPTGLHPTITTCQQIAAAMLPPPSGKSPRPGKTLVSLQGIAALSPRDKAKRLKKNEKQNGWESELRPISDREKKDTKPRISSLATRILTIRQSSYDSVLIQDRQRGSSILLCTDRNTYGVHLLACFHLSPQNITVLTASTLSMSIEPTSKQLLVMESWHLASFYGVTVSITLLERRDRLGLFQECLLSGPKTTSIDYCLPALVSRPAGENACSFVSNALSHQRWAA
ncbi:uncharacterized protein CIMG_10692 [Coccidioides immitis RS]|uniref:Uncharacterized protein n=1 Tax=Coccidioides immitis (strain RS) TaxID=246410 RepID=A0A0D8JVB2_COCIM|nr:uncharacterized protein CIMG_10692 [Coccidioides immitis RS]KJF60203.1 hypothetical protein CIMG_10692 [Coccidioides immitis RS]